MSIPNRNKYVIKGVPTLEDDIRSLCDRIAASYQPLETLKDNFPGQKGAFFPVLYPGSAAIVQVAALNSRPPKCLSRLTPAP